MNCLYLKLKKALYQNDTKLFIKIVEIVSIFYDPILMHIQ